MRSHIFLFGSLPRRRPPEFTAILMFEFWREATATSVPALLCQSGRRRPGNVSILTSLFTSATGRIGVYFAPKYGTKPIRYVNLHFRDRQDAASLRYRNRATTTVFACEQKPSPVWFSWRRKSCPVLREYSLNRREKISVFKNSRPICVDGASCMSIRRAFDGNLSLFL